MIYDHSLSVRPWTPIDSMLAWIRIPNLSLMLYDPNVVIEIASMIGKPIKEKAREKRVDTEPKTTGPTHLIQSKTWQRKCPRKYQLSENLDVSQEDVQQHPVPLNGTDKANHVLGTIQLKQTTYLMWRSWIIRIVTSCGTVMGVFTSLLMLSGLIPPHQLFMMFTWNCCGGVHKGGRSAHDPDDVMVFYYAQDKLVPYHLGHTYHPKKFGGLGIRETHSMNVVVTVLLSANGIIKAKEALKEDFTFMVRKEIHQLANKPAGTLAKASVGNDDSLVILGTPHSEVSSLVLFEKLDSK
ncbi:hypothetical protein VNO78_02817 [Psophocarpus tetragonolobus]|uniref:DUF4283 domain-containing protein n=1 Tax=Psophocarpus tetragonolobus TaxID=3891 RepID=A0AAN9T1Y9_PSOTE